MALSARPATGNAAVRAPAAATQRRPATGTAMRIAALERFGVAPAPTPQDEGSPAWRGDVAGASRTVVPSPRVEVRRGAKGLVRLTRRPVSCDATRKRLSPGAAPLPTHAAVGDWVVASSRAADPPPGDALTRVEAHAISSQVAPPPPAMLRVLRTAHQEFLVAEVARLTRAFEHQLAAVAAELRASRDCDGRKLTVATACAASPPRVPRPPPLKPPVWQPAPPLAARPPQRAARASSTAAAPPLEASAPRNPSTFCDDDGYTTATPLINFELTRSGGGEGPSSPRSRRTTDPFHDVSRASAPRALSTTHRYAAPLSSPPEASPPEEDCEGAAREAECERLRAVVAAERGRRDALAAAIGKQRELNTAMQNHSATRAAPVRAAAIPQLVVCVAQSPPPSPTPSLSLENGTVVGGGADPRERLPADRAPDAGSASDSESDSRAFSRSLASTSLSMTGFGLTTGGLSGVAAAVAAFNDSLSIPSMTEAAAAATPFAAPTTGAEGEPARATSRGAQLRLAAARRTVFIADGTPAGRGDAFGDDAGEGEQADGAQPPPGQLLTNIAARLSSVTELVEPKLRLWTTVRARLARQLRGFTDGGVATAVAAVSGGGGREFFAAPPSFFATVLKRPERQPPNLQGEIAALLRVHERIADGLIAAKALRAREKVLLRKEKSGAAAAAAASAMLAKIAVLEQHYGYTQAPSSPADATTSAATLARPGPRGGSSMAARRSHSGPGMAVARADVGVQSTLDDELTVYCHVRTAALLEKERLVRRLIRTMQITLANVALFWSGAEADLTCLRCCRVMRDPIIIAPCGSSVCRVCVLPSDDSGEEVMGRECGCAVHDAHIPNDAAQLVSDFFVDGSSGASLGGDGAAAEAALQDVAYGIQRLLFALGIEDVSDQAELHTAISVAVARHGESAQEPMAARSDAHDAPTAAARGRDRHARAARGAKATLAQPTPQPRLLPTVGSVEETISSLRRDVRKQQDRRVLERLGLASGAVTDAAMRESRTRIALGGVGARGAPTFPRR